MLAAGAAMNPLVKMAGQAASDLEDKLQQAMGNTTVRVWVKDDHTNNGLDSTFVEFVNRVKDLDILHQKRSFESASLLVFSK